MLQCSYWNAAKLIIMAGNYIGSVKGKVAFGKPGYKPGSMVARMNKHKTMGIKCKSCGMSYKKGSMHKHNLSGMIKGAENFAGNAVKNVETFGKGFGKSASVVGKGMYTIGKRMLGDTSDIKQTLSYKKKGIKTKGTFKGKSNKLGHGGRAAQLRAKGVPGGVIGMLARRAQAAPGMKNYHGKK